MEIIAEFEFESANEFGLKVRKGNNEETVVGYDVKESVLFLDRTKSGNTKFSRYFPGKFKAPLPPMNKHIKMHIFVDRSSVEVFGNQGEIVFTSQIFPSPDSQDLELYSKDGDVHLLSIEVYKLKSIWRK